MPTGYTAAVQSGEITEFADYAMNCARAFGALLDMRDAPAGAEIPDEIIPSDYHYVQQKAAEQQLKIFNELSGAALTAKYEEKCASDTKEYLERKERKLAEHERYLLMLKKAKDFEAPTPEHENFAKFLVEQLEQSIEFDCFEVSEPEQETYHQWKATTRENYIRSIEFHRSAFAEEVQRAKDKTKWLNQLRNAIAGEPSCS